MASIHLYDLPTVAATLLYSIQINDTKTVVEACSELVESGSTSLALSVLRLALSLAPFSGLSPTIMLSTDITVLLGAVMAVGGYELPLRRTPPLGPLLYTTKTVPWVPKSVANHATIWIAIKDAVKHGRIERAAFLASAIKEDADLTSLFASFDIDATYSKWLPLVIRERVIFHAFSSLSNIKSVVSSPHALRLPMPAGKAGRTFAVPVQALQTWGISAPPLSQLIGEPVWVVLKACSALKPIITKCGIVGTGTGLIAKDDDALEEFYSTVFPDDIPDEWSATERAKSHGQQGVVFIANPWISAFKLL